MRQKKKITISLMMTLMMIASTFIVGAANMKITTVDPGLTVTKTVWDGEEWVDEIYAEMDDDVRFNITITYYPVDQEVGYKAIELLVNDTLPDCLEYNDTTVIKYGDNEYSGETAIDGKTIWWDLYDDPDYQITLWDDPAYGSRTVYIEFNATVVDYGVNVNHVNVTGKEKCSNEPLFGDDEATVIVCEPENPDVNIDKKVWDEDEWVDGPVTVYTGDEVRFKINVTNTGNVKLHDVFITDVLPDFLMYGGPLTNNIGDLNVGESFEGEFTTYVTCLDEIKTGENYVNVTCDEDAYDEDDVDLVAKPHLIVDKKVWNGTGWADELESVTKGEEVKFKITTTYYGEDMVDCGLVGDLLPDLCLEYIETTKVKVAGEVLSPSSNKYPYIIPDSGVMLEVCGDEINITEVIEECPCIHGNILIWDFRDAVDFDLIDGQSIVIEFTALVTDYCDDCYEQECECCQECCYREPCMTINVACALMWGCHICDQGNYYADCDFVPINCCPPPTTFTKKVLDGECWVDEIETYKGETVTFKLELKYYGNENLTDIHIFDELPCVLEYIEGTASITPTYISENKKILWWNLTYDLEDGDSVVITFDALVTGTTGSGTCSGCQEECICENYASVRGEIGCPPEFFFMEDTVAITALSNCPPSEPGVSGPSSGETDEELTFSTKATDSDGDKVQYKWDFGDGTVTGYSSLYDEGVSKTKKHTYTSEGTYYVKVKARDEHGAESGWTLYPHKVVITDAEEPPEKELAITINKLNFGGAVGAVIENVGDLDVDDITWNITVEGGFLRSFSVSNEGTIETLEDGDSEEIESDSTGFKLFALGTVKVTAEAPGDISAEEEVNAIFFAKIIWIPDFLQEE